MNIEPWETVSFAECAGLPMISISTILFSPGECLEQLSHVDSIHMDNILMVKGSGLKKFSSRVFWCKLFVSYFIPHKKRDLSSVRCESVKPLTTPLC